MKRGRQGETARERGREKRREGARENVNFYHTVSSFFCPLGISFI